MKEYKLADAVSMRLVQIFQEALMTGVDGADLLRQVRLRESTESDVLELTPEYKTFVDESHKKLIQQAQDMQSKKG